MGELKLSIVKLEINIDMLTKAIEKIPRLEKDINEAHSKIRQMVEAKKHV